LTDVCAILITPNAGRSAHQPPVVGTDKRAERGRASLWQGDCHWKECQG